MVEDVGELRICKPFTSAETIKARQVRAARAWLNLSQDDLAATTLIARRAIQDFENGKREPQPRTLRDLRNALEQAGIEFLFIAEHAAGILQARSGLRKKRAGLVAPV